MAPPAGSKWPGHTTSWPCTHNSPLPESRRHLKLSSREGPSDNTHISRERCPRSSRWPFSGLREPQRMGRGGQKCRKQPQCRQSPAQGGRSQDGQRTGGLSEGPQCLAVHEALEEHVSLRGLSSPMPRLQEAQNTQHGSGFFGHTEDHQ